MKNQREKMVSLLLAKETEIKELQDFILQLQTQLQATQTEYAKLYKLHYLTKSKVKRVRKIIGFNRKGGYP